ncbi:hypothetical protein AB8O64_27515 [Streptomyces sp. QH1-20]|uniref:hypothetical protein n=1 Tax=Streptomyces sp. QH1-20 TaxID=3240934 RepID=UPI003518FB6E
MSNEVIRHPNLGSDAVRLLTWHLSLPDEVDQPLSETAKRAGIKKTGFIRAKRQLAAEGYFHEWRRQGAAGRWSTTQLISNVPLTADDAVEVRDGRPADVIPAAGAPEGRAVGRSPRNTDENNYNPPSPSAIPDDQDGAEPSAEREGEPISPEATESTDAAAPSVPAPLVERAGRALAAVSHSERRLRLSGREVAALAPLVGEWFQRGAGMAELRDALTSGLPEAVHSPAGIVRDRLVRKMPTAPTFAEQRAAERRAAAPSRVAGARECQGDHVQAMLFRPVADEVLCRQCRCEAAEADQDAGGSVAATLRGAGAVREALCGAAGVSA